MTDRYLRHLTITTAHARDSYREEVSDEAVAVCGVLIERLADSGEEEALLPFPALPGYWISGRVTARAMICTVWADEERQVPVLTVGVATTSKSGAQLWRLMHDSAAMPVTADPERCPPEPWVAALLQPGAALAGREAMMVFGDFERCLGWAFLERGEK